MPRELIWEMIEKVAGALLRNERFMIDLRRMGNRRFLIEFWWR